MYFFGKYNQVFEKPHIIRIKVTIANGCTKSFLIKANQIIVERIIREYIRKILKV